MKKSISTIKTYSFPGVKDIDRGIKKLEKKGYKLLTNEFNGLFKKVEVENAKEGKIEIVANFIKYEGKKEEVKTEKVAKDTKAKDTKAKKEKTKNTKAKNTKAKKEKTDKKLVAVK